jgi:hypothetical protein
MKHIFRYFISSLVLLVPVLAHAQTQVADPPLYDDYKTGNGIATQKKVSEPHNGRYVLTLETFATGKTSVVKVTSPADIVLVLDLSQSMTDVYGDNYVARNGEYSYNSLRSGNADKAYYFYRHTDGNYYQVHTAGGNNQRRLRYQVGNTWWYLWENGSQNSNPQGNRGDNATIFTGNLYERTRLTALQGAVENFVNVIYHNDNFDDDDNPRETPLTNRISVVTFGGPQGNSNVTRQMSPLTNVTNSDGSLNTSMISGLLNLTGDGINNSDHYGTYADEGMALANTVLNGIPAARKGQSTRTVVLFTDGAPGSGPGWTTGNQATNSQPTADRCIQAAATAKTTHTASVFTIILGDIANENMGNYLQYTSSNYPDATRWSNPGDKKSETYALEAGEDLEGIFETVAHASGGSEKNIPSGTQVVDAVSNSFEVPSSFKAQDVVVYTRDALTDGSGFAEDTTHLKKVILPDTYDLSAAPNPSASYMTNDNTVGVYLKDGKLMIIGFNYSQLDTVDEETGEITKYGNWVGWRGDGVDCRGKELVIEFEIEAKDGVTGGDGTNTNAPNSGVYIPVYNDDGSFQGYAIVDSYPYPQTDLPINIVIEKEGLRRGESATIQIYYAPVNKKEYDKNTGKPVPDLTEGWKNFSKVILTNTTDTDGATVTKTLLCLDPEYVYRLEEDNWGWGYELDTKTTDTSKQESNPFVFKNKLDTKAVKHAEAVSINIFGEGGGSKTYKGSKVNSW